MCQIKPIHTEEDYEFALEEIEALFEAVPGNAEADKLDIMVTLVEQYEDQHFAIPHPNPIEAILYHMESRGLSHKDLEPFIGPRARVSEILNRKRPLTLRMIRALSDGLGISADILVQPYPLNADLEPA